MPTTIPAPLVVMFDVAHIGGNLRRDDATGKVTLEADPGKVNASLIASLREHRAEIAMLAALKSAAALGTLPTSAEIPLHQGGVFLGDMNPRVTRLFKESRDAYRYMRFDWGGWAHTGWPGMWKSRAEELMTYSEWWRLQAEENGERR